jgi:hypothetical protein
MTTKTSTSNQSFTRKRSIMVRTTIVRQFMRFQFGKKNSVSGSSARIQFLSHSDFKSVSSFLQKPTLPRCFLIVITLVWLNQVSHVRMCWKSENVVHNAIIGSFLRLYWIWGQKFRFLILRHFAQHRNSSNPVDFKVV